MIPCCFVFLPILGRCVHSGTTMFPRTRISVFFVIWSSNTNHHFIVKPMFWNLQYGECDERRWAEERGGGIGLDGLGAFVSRALCEHLFGFLHSFFIQYLVSVASLAWWIDHRGCSWCYEMWRSTLPSPFYRNPVNNFTELTSNLTPISRLLLYLLHKLNSSSSHLL